MQKTAIWIFSAIVVVCLVGFNIDLMDIDASQYAEISREMMSTGEYLQVHELGEDYLDKPPLLFWLSAFSMNIFGANNFAYRLPSFLFSLLSLYAVFKFALLFYQRQIALLAAIILGTCQAFFLINHDVRTDTILISCVIVSTWQLAAWLKSNRIIFFVVGCIFIGAGMLAKGPIALIIPIMAFGIHFLLQRNFKAIFRWEYLLGILIILGCLVPMSIGLYHQFDLHPEKVINNKTNVSGLRFYFWTQSFGRITGESTWNNNRNIFFLMQNLLWAYLPWIFVFFSAIFLELKNLVQQRFKLAEGQEWICAGGFILTYLALGVSKYQLPHYIFVALPFASVLTAKYIYKLTVLERNKKILKIFEKSHFILFVLLWIVLLVLIFYSFDDGRYFKYGAAAFFVLFFVAFLKKRPKYYLVYMCAAGMLGLNFFINLLVYPSLLQYQVGSNIARWANEKHIPKNRLYIYKEHIWHSLPFYANQIIPHKDSLTNVLPGDYLIMPKSTLEDSLFIAADFMQVFEMESFEVSKLKLKFLSPEKRNELTKRYVVVKVINN